MNNDRIITYIQNSIDEKFSHLLINHEKPRQKRGLINGLGSIIKSITGNLDAEDEKRYTHILKHLESNQYKLNEQLKNQYSLNHELIEKFNKTVETIKHNELELKLKIEQLLHIVVGGTHNLNKLIIYDIYSQLNTLFSMILSVMKDIENSLTFCKLHAMHPSIIKINDLYSELNRIYKNYNNEFPLEPTLENIPEFEKLITVNCKLHSNKIIYFLEIPINYETNFELFHLIPIPSKHETEFVTVILNKEYFLKSYDGQIKSLKDTCTKGTIYQCPNKIEDTDDRSCEKNIILHNDNKHCKYTKVNLKENHVETIEEINQFLVVFPIQETISASCQLGDEIKTIQGIFLISENNCQMKFRNQKLNFQEGTFGKPIILENFKIELDETQIPRLTVELNSIQDLKLPINKFEDIEDYNVTADIANYSIVILYIILLIIAATMFTVLLRKKFLNSAKPSRTQDHELQPRCSTLQHQQPQLNLPGDARF